MEREPVATFKVHEHLRSKLCDLYESDAIFDKFQCCLSRDGSRLATGSFTAAVCFDFCTSAPGSCSGRGQPRHY